MEWAHSFRIALDAIDLTYWAVLEGQNEPRFEPAFTKRVYWIGIMKSEMDADS